MTGYTKGGSDNFLYSKAINFACADNLDGNFAVVHANMQRKWENWIYLEEYNHWKWNYFTVYPKP